MWSQSYYKTADSLHKQCGVALRCVVRNYDPKCLVPPPSAKSLSVCQRTKAYAQMKINATKLKVQIANILSLSHTHWHSFAFLTTTINTAVAALSALQCANEFTAGFCCIIIIVIIITKQSVSLVTRTLSSPQCSHTFSSVFIPK